MPALPRPSSFTTRAVALSAALTAALALSACGGEDHAGHMDSGAPPATSATPASKAAAANPKAAAVDGAFVRQMIPHHEMAVMMAEMAQAGTIEHDELRQLTDDVIETQSQEIATLRTIAKDLAIPLAAGGGDQMSSDHGSMGHGAGGDELEADAKTLGLSVDEMGMSMDMAPLRDADPVDVAFVEGMIPHHEGAIAMAKAQLAGGQDERLRELSEAIIAAQEREIEEMERWLKAWS